jgi:hypothetical protein
MFEWLKIYDLFQSDWKWILASFFMRFSGSLSIAGSAIILYMILSDRRVKLKRVHNRILLGMSAFEIINSSAWLMSVSAVPKGTDGSYGAKGNQQTCTLQGFMLQVGLVVPFYSLSLCVYHYLVISRNVTDAKISKNVEPYMHIISILFPLSTAIAGIPLQLYNFNGAICYIVASPLICLITPFIPCTRNKHYVKYLIGFVGTWITLISLLITVLMIIIYCSVRNRVRAMSRFNFRTRDGIVVRSSSYIQLCRDKRETGIQALLYISAFFLTYIWSGINLMYNVDKTPNDPPDILNLLIFFFQPLQGLWNFFIYIRPRYRLISSHLPQKSFWSKLMIAIFHPEVSRRLSSTEGHRNRRRSSNGSLVIPSNARSGGTIKMTAMLVQLEDVENGLVLKDVVNMCTSSDQTETKVQEVLSDPANLPTHVPDPDEG